MITFVGGNCPASEISGRDIGAANPQLVQALQISVDEIGLFHQSTKIAVHQRKTGGRKEE
jgi:hypothetical protein